MVVIVRNREIRAGVDRVWDTLVDWEGEKRYWTNVRYIRVLKSEGTTIEREATVGPRGFARKTRQTVILEPKKSIRLEFTGEGISGERTILVVPSAEGRTRVDVAWSLEIAGVPGFVEGIVSSQIAKVTEDALKKIAAVAERGASSP